jgi:hypothetical protein
MGLGEMAAKLARIGNYTRKKDGTLTAQNETIL